MSKRLECADHPKNHYVGGCISCTYNEMRRYQVLYEDALEIIRTQQDAKVAAKHADAGANSFLYAESQGFHKFIVEPAE